jgi:S1-C subfamily serine protease
MGTAFTIDQDGRQYFVTARHVCPTISDGNSISVCRHRQWTEWQVKVVGIGSDEAIDNDVVVLALDDQISPSFPMRATSEDLVWGQDVFFLGYPYGIYTSANANDGYPLALIKRGLMSGSTGEQGRPETFLLDGHNNPGFSGGPVVFRPANKPKADFRVMGIVSGYRTEDVSITFDGKPTGLASRANTGIVVCPSIKQVTDMIAAHPIGPLLRY